jgi:1-acyl-sn-glycerol-3-phosphate acyltransferase
LSQLLRVRYSLRAHRPAGLFEGDARTGDRPGACSLILAPNHQTLVDPVLLATALPYGCFRALIPVRALASQSFRGPFRVFTPIVKALYWLGGAIQLPPKGDGDDGSLPDKLQGLLDALMQGDVVLIFPEGEIGGKKKPPVGKFMPGVVYLHRMSGAPIVPVAIWMSEPGARRDGCPRRRCAIEFGRPVRIPEHLDLEAGAAWLREQSLALYEQAKLRSKMPRAAGSSYPARST